MTTGLAAPSGLDGDRAAAAVVVEGRLGKAVVGHGNLALVMPRRTDCDDSTTAVAPAAVSSDLSSHIEWSTSETNTSIKRSDELNELALLPPSRRRSNSSRFAMYAARRSWTFFKYVARSREASWWNLPVMDLRPRDGDEDAIHYNTTLETGGGYGCKAEYRTLEPQNAQ